MATKKKPQQNPVSAIKIESQKPVVQKEEVYIPSVNAAKYPEPETHKLQYKILAFKNDYIRLQDEITNHLNDGWKLVGGVACSMNVSQYESVTVFAQAITK